MERRLPVWTVIVLLCLVTLSKAFLIERSNNDIDDPIYTCPSEIYCHGPLLHTVQMAAIYNDSKTFVDMKMRQPPTQTLQKFEEFIGANPNPSKEQILEFVKANFEEPGKEFEDWIPDDWHDSPQFVKNIKDAKLKQFALDLNDLWLKLGRKMRPEVETDQELYSIIHVHNPVIVPGGRFREFYYWDSYWIVRGLLLSEMYKTTKGMLENFLSIVDRYGMIPNGGRIYYSRRSQPPLLTFMVKEYVDFVKDDTFAKQHVDTLAKEFNFWVNGHTIDVKGHKMFKYGDDSLGPRPESYKEDVDTGESFTSDADREEHYSELKAAAESGMDFSSRWFINDDGTNSGTLVHLKTRYIVPVELNAILYWNAKYLAELYTKLNRPTEATTFEEHAKNILAGIEAVLWNEEAGIWLDYDTINDKPRDYFVPTNLSPLWMKCFDADKATEIADKVMSYINRTGIDTYPGGVPNSLNPTGEQWDYPNVWPPMQHMLIEGLENLKDNRTSEVALRWATRWIQSNYLAWDETHAMYEKYSAEELGGHGGGGEYEVQLGFGWSNGAVMDLMNTYGDRVEAPDDKARNFPLTD